MEKVNIRVVIKGIKDFVGSDWDTYTKEEKLKWIRSYRKSEEDTNREIEKYGSVQAWYESGEGRLLDLNFKE